MKRGSLQRYAITKYSSFGYVSYDSRGIEGSTQLNVQGNRPELEERGGVGSVSGGWTNPELVLAVNSPTQLWW